MSSYEEFQKAVVGNIIQRELKLKELDKLFSKKRLAELYSECTTDHINLIRWLYANHREILREYEKTKGNLRTHFMEGKHETK